MANANDGRLLSRVCLVPFRTRCPELTRGAAGPRRSSRRELILLAGSKKVGVRK